MTFSIWTFFTDLGLIAVLLLLGQFVRARMKAVQRLFLPANVLAGLAGLLLGPGGLAFLPLSAACATYPSILIALIFASLPFSSQTSERGSLRQIFESLWSLWSYSTTTMLLQWGFGILFSLLLLNAVWPELHPGFGTVLASGFVGGHGTAAAVGSAFADRGWNEATALATTAATVGIVASVVGGLTWIKWGASRGETRYVTRFADLPTELRTGLVPPDKRPIIGRETISPITLDPLLFHFAIVVAASIMGYFIGLGCNELLGDYRLPNFCLAFLAAIMCKHLLKVGNGLHYIDSRVVSRIGGSLTDLLVAFGIATINVSILIRYAAPLAALFAFGLLMCWILFRFVGPRVFNQRWFENALYTWGWVTGIMAMAIALLRIVDPERKSRVLDDFALAYLAIGPVEILLLYTGPLLISQGNYWLFAGLTSTAAMLLLFVSLSRKPH